MWLLWIALRVVIGLCLAALLTVAEEEDKRSTQPTTKNRAQRRSWAGVTRKKPSAEPTE